MRRWLADAPIRQKLMALGLITSALALVVSSVVFLLTSYLVARRQTHDSVVAQSVVAADNVSAAIAFGDRQAAAEVLGALRAMPSIDVVCVWDESGVFFAAYQPSLTTPCPAVAPGELDRTNAGHVEIGRPVLVGGARRVGSLYIRANLNEVATRMRAQAVATVVALLLGALAAAAFAARFRRAIAGPLTALATTAHDISARGDYSVRVPSTDSHDELGELVATFNDMLQEIERRDFELRTANRLKDEFLATVSHELRTPLNAILGWLQILQMTPVSKERLDHALKSLDRNARAQARLVEDLLDVSRIVAGKLRLKVGVIDATQVVEAAVDVTRAAAEAKGIALDAQIDAGPHLVKGDPDRLQQAVWNLLANAVKFTDPGGRITISLSHTSDEAIVVVEDNGIGIDPLFLPHVFEPFRQADASSTRKHPGLGLGLAIVREISHAHGGKAEAFSAGRGRGARFVLRLPCAQSQSPAALTPRVSGTDTILRGISAIVVDDDADARELAAIALAARGAYVATAADAAGALDLVGIREVDVIVADLAMPVLDGYGLLARLRSGESATGRQLPVIALTAQASADEEGRALAAGFAAYLRKPYRLEELVQAVARAARLPGGRTQGDFDESTSASVDH